jgi:hypothetical protein
MHMIRQFQVPKHNGTAAQRAVRTDAGAAGHTDTAGQGAVCTNLHVVADLHQVVQLDPICYVRRSLGSATPLRPSFI